VPLPTNGSQCVPYGVPTMMSVAVYPVEFIQTAKQITIISEAFSEVRRVYLGKPQLPVDEVPPGASIHEVQVADDDDHGRVSSSLSYGVVALAVSSIPGAAAGGGSV